ncbi:MAG: 50S ribosomal protein L37ae [archaeon]|mgnify:CR=1 FL=1|jgi:large subunit ribosomal protein L37Ae|nr:50S ribosomal protein L37ae [Euryarchaeota archaeon]MDP6704256.1 50S ribosomal protein L37ae [archaeon]|tara:strand:- start:25547 stop:25858 length:312 start_codon:yes stop_codon:yes gene_type:complete
MRTKLVGSAGRFGQRYGRKVRLRTAAIEKYSKAKHPCPSCKAKKVRREFVGVWRCRKCDLQFSAGAYSPSSSIEEIKARLSSSGVSQKTKDSEQSQEEVLDGI